MQQLGNQNLVYYRILESQSFEELQRQMNQAVSDGYFAVSIHWLANVRVAALMQLAPGDDLPEAGPATAPATRPAAGGQARPEPEDSVVQALRDMTELGERAKALLGQTG